MIDVKALAQDLDNISEDISLLKDRIEEVRAAILVAKFNAELDKFKAEREEK